MDALYFVPVQRYNMANCLEHTGKEDPRCPVAGLEITISDTRKAFENANCSNNFKVLTHTMKLPRFSITSSNNTIFGIVCYNILYENDLLYKTVRAIDKSFCSSIMTYN